MQSNRLYQILHLAARIHGLIWASFPEFEVELIDIVTESGKRQRKKKADQISSVTGELPVLILISAIRAQESVAPEMDPEEAEFLKSCLIHFFATHTSGRYLEQIDPIKELLARVDWYLDGKKESPGQLFDQFVTSIFPDLKEASLKRLDKLINLAIAARIEKALDLAPRYNF